MRAAFTLREFKEHEQTPLLEATLASLPRRQGMDEFSRRRYLDGVTMTLQQPSGSHNSPNKKPRLLNLGGGGGANKHLSAAEQTERAKQQAELEQKRQEHMEREQARRRREEEDRKKRQEENSKQQHAVIETPQQALHKFYFPIYKLLWDLEFPYLGNTNPFRMVIDRDTCASVGAPDYFDVIDKPMNLTYIQRKVNAMEYESLSAFFQDVDLMIKNALTYNSDVSNPYRVAAEEMQKKYKRAAKKTVQTIQKKHGAK